MFGDCLIFAPYIFLNYSWVAVSTLGIGVDYVKILPQLVD